MQDVMTRKLWESLQNISQTCSKYSVDTCSKCPMYIDFENRGCVFQQRRCPEFMDDNLIMQINEPHFTSGDLLDKAVDVIGHQTNCLGVMGAGIAKQIKTRWPEVFDEYKKLCDNCGDKHDLLGTTQLVKRADGGYVANVFGEFSFTEDAKGVVPGTNRHTDYFALKKALEQLRDDMEARGLKVLGLPDHMGCGLAGGDWDGVVLPMIKEVFEYSHIEAWIVKYEK